MNVETGATVTSGIIAETEYVIKVVAKNEVGETVQTIEIISKELNLADIIGEIQTITQTAKDENGNKIVVPGGFKIVPDGTENVEYTYSGNGNPCVQDGIVIEDNEGNQFVWIPVGEIKNKDKTTTTITLGRYTFNTTTGTPTLHQNAINYSDIVNIRIDGYSWDHQELENNSGNTASKNLSAFVIKTNSNGGYYLGRYEASKGSDDKVKLHADKTVWTNITQPAAATAAQEMYHSNYIESDLVNSYSWDTAIIFIQNYSGNNNYANKKSVNSSISNAGKTGDKVCNIHAMASNCSEWSTEHFSDTRFPCGGRGGQADKYTFTASYRGYQTPSYTHHLVSFRPILYLK